MVSKLKLSKLVELVPDLASNGCWLRIDFEENVILWSEDVVLNSNGEDQIQTVDLTYKAPMRWGHSMNSSTNNFLDLESACVKDNYSEI